MPTRPEPRTDWPARRSRAGGECSFQPAISHLGKTEDLLDDRVHLARALDLARFFAPLDLIDDTVVAVAAIDEILRRPARTISPPPRRAASRMSPSTRSAAWRSKTWSRAAGSIASCATSAPGSR